MKHANNRIGEIEDRFFVCDGKVLTTVLDLAEALVLMSDDTYYYHANEHKNDFATWVQHISHNDELAEQLRNAEHKDDAFMVLMDAVDLSNETLTRERIEHMTRVAKEKEHYKQKTPKKRSIRSEEKPKKTARGVGDSETITQEKDTSQESATASEKRATPDEQKDPAQVKQNKQDGDQDSASPTKLSPTIAAVNAVRHAQEQAAFMKQELRVADDPDTKEAPRKESLFGKVLKHFNNPAEKVAHIPDEVADETARDEEAEERAAEQAEQEQNNEDQEEVQTTAQPHTETEQLNKRFSKIEADLMQLRAQQDAFNETRKVSNERFMHISEELGSLRSNAMNLEKEMKDIMVRVVKSVNLVETIQPEKLFSESKKQTAKIEALEARIDGNKSMIDQEMEQIKEVRQKLGVFRGVEEILKLNTEVKEKLLAIQKIKVLTERHADKIENMFVDVKKKFDRFEKFEEIGREMKEAADAHAGDIDKLKEAMSNVLTPEKLEEVRNENAESAELVLGQVNEVKESLAAISSKVENFDPEQLGTQNEKVTALSTEATETAKKLSEIQDELANLKHMQEQLSEDVKKAARKKRSSGKSSSGDMEKLKAIMLKQFEALYKSVHASLRDTEKKCMESVQTLRKDINETRSKQRSEAFTHLKRVHSKKAQHQESDTSETLRSFKEKLSSLQKKYTGTK